MPLEYVLSFQLAFLVDNTLDIAYIDLIFSILPVFFTDSIIRFLLILICLELIIIDTFVDV